MTGAGRAVLAEARPLHTASVRRHLIPLTPDERTALRATLERFVSPD